MLKYLHLHSLFYSFSSWIYYDIFHLFLISIKFYNFWENHMRNYLETANTKPLKLFHCFYLNIQLCLQNIVRICCFYLISSSKLWNKDLNTSLNSAKFSCLSKTSCQIIKKVSNKYWFCSFCIFPFLFISYSKRTFKKICFHFLHFLLFFFTFSESS